MEQPAKPLLITGDLVVDDRGEVMFVKGFEFNYVKRFYVIRNHSRNFVRAWHAHKKEAKYVCVTEGAAIVGAVRIDNWDKPRRDLVVDRYVISAKKPAVLYVPPGYANGFMSLSDNTQVTFYSTSTLEESKADDFRYDARYWDIWKIEEH